MLEDFFKKDKLVILIWVPQNIFTSETNTKSTLI
jgi:hypothetical protein